MVWIGYILFGVIIFIFNIIISNKYKLSKRDILIINLIYLLVLAGMFSRFGILKFNENVFMIFVVEVFCQLFYVNYFLEKNFFDKSDNYLLFTIIKIFLAYVINKELINKVSDVFLSGDNLKEVVWLLIIVYLFQFLKDKKEFISSENEVSISKENIAVSFARLKLSYGEDIIVSDESRKLVIYAIMIFNNYKRPKFFRKLDSLCFKLNNKPRKLGIMQIMSKKYINDYESIITATKKIEKLYEKSKKDIDVINLYDKDNSKEIIFIYNELTKFCKL